MLRQAAFTACREAGASKKTHSVLQAYRSDPGGLKGLARRLFDNPISREALSRPKVTGNEWSGKGYKPLDMLEEYLVSSAHFLKQDSKSKAIISSEAYRIIEEAYNQRKDMLSTAVVANDSWS